MLYRGKVINYNPKKNFGFIECPNFPNNVFFHIKSLIRNSNAGIIIEVGEELEFEVLHTKRGPKAINIKRISNF